MMLLRFPGEMERIIFCEYCVSYVVNELVS